MSNFSMDNIQRAVDSARHSGLNDFFFKSLRVTEDVPIVVDVVKIDVVQAGGGLLATKDLRIQDVVLAALKDIRTQIDALVAF